MTIAPTAPELNERPRRTLDGVTPWVRFSGVPR